MTNPDPHARFQALIDSWSRQALADHQRISEQGDGKAQWRRTPLWNCIALAKKTQTDSDWIMAMSMLAQASLDNKRPIMVAATALSSIQRQGHDVPFEALRALVDPILHERDMGAPDYDWTRNFPVERAEQAWEMALQARALIETPVNKKSP